MGFTTILQCDLKRTLTINENKNLHDLADRRYEHSQGLATEVPAFQAHGDAKTATVTARRCRQRNQHNHRHR